MNKLIFCLMIIFSISVYAKEINFDVNFNLVKKIKFNDLKYENCNQIIRDNINVIPYNFIDIGAGIFQSNSENWNAYIECAENEIMLNVQSKSTIEEGYEVLNSDTIEDKINRINQAINLLNFNNVK